MSQKRLIKEGSGYWDPDTGNIYNSDGVLVMHDCVYRLNNQPRINFGDYTILDENGKTIQNANEVNIPENKFEYVSWSARDFDLPTRSTEKSAGYDFHSPVDVIINPGETVRFSLEVKVKIKDWEFLMIVPRSSLGFKGTNHITLTNTVGIIDQDYYNNPDNEGVIELKLHNYGPEPFVIHKNDRVVQGIFCRFDTVSSDVTTASRTGGLGSTGK